MPLRELLAADAKAAEGRELYDDATIEAFSRASLPLVERRMSDAISAVASVIVAAWQKAGRPALVVAPRGPRKSRGSSGAEPADGAPSSERSWTSFLIPVDSSKYELYYEAPDGQ